MTTIDRDVAHEPRTEGSSEDLEAPERDGTRSEPRTLGGARIAGSVKAPLIRWIAALVALATLLLLVNATLTAERANELAQDRQVRLAFNALEGAGQNLLLGLGRSAVSDEAYRRVHLAFDPDFSAAAFRDRFNEEDMRGAALVVGPSGRLLQAFIGSMQANSATLAPVLDASTPLVEKIAAEVAALNPADLAGRAIGSTGYALVAGEPVILAAMAIVPDRDRTLSREGAPTVLVVMHRIEGGLIAEMARGLDLADLRFLPAAPGLALPARAAVPLMGIDGGPVGALVWTPVRPGYQLLQQFMPVMALAAAMFILFALVVVRQFDRTTRELAESEARTKHAALHDHLSGLPNRALFTTRLGRDLADLQAAGGAEARSLAVVFIDLDRFKDVNDTLGHQAGDEVIRAVAGRLAGLARPGDTAARIAGDEFAFLIRSAPDRLELEKRLRLIVSEIARPIPFADRTIYSGASVGCAVAPSHGLDPAELQRKADIALYRAKGGGRGRWLVYSSDMDDGRSRRTALRQELRAALAENRLSIQYQPVFAVVGMSPIGVEARVSWDHPTRGRINAVDFVPIAEEIGLIREMGSWVLRQACRDAKAWADVSLAVNVSPLEIRHPTFATDLLATLAEEGLDPRRLQVELTENVLISDADVAITVIGALRNAGVTVALDEFGSGQSSFNYLARFRFDLVKIDGSIVSRIETSPEVATIVHTMVDLAHKLGLKTSAEGIERFSQFRFVQACGCDTVQGHLFARPMPAAEVSAILSRPFHDRLRVVSARDARKEISVGL